MKRYLIVPLTKSPHPKGRSGPVEWQDWYRGLVKSVALLRVARKWGESAKILVVSNVQVAGQPHEADLYESTLIKMGVTPDEMVVVREAYETIEQAEYATGVGRKDRDLIVISTFLHYLRVRWIFRGVPRVRHYACFGIPRPREALTDIVLTFIFPLIDILGRREWFQEKVTGRRVQGKHI